MYILIAPSPLLSSPLSSPLPVEVSIYGCQKYTDPTLIKWSHTLLIFLMLSILFFELILIDILLYLNLTGEEESLSLLYHLLLFFLLLLI